ncbi:DUF1330 domain-containing protein [Reichenbachiella versicolor]|uniref:DUF1330 domain-containing protein n=1 Tax=Reichenbachiella versicolor TaxID=1821036 RepID=UPI000D6DDD67|nr:DUF1330 domain-containing protein [Reichenbachiella versicolor]
MSAYVILDLTVFDKEKLQEYKNLAPKIIKEYNGKIIVRGGQTNSVEGDWNPQRLVVIEFPDYETANNWWNSDEYRSASELRRKGAHTNVLIVEGT